LQAHGCKTANAAPEQGKKGHDKIYSDEINKRPNNKIFGRLKSHSSFFST